MAKLVLISNKLVKANVQEEGDIVTVVKDDYRFSPDELNLFDFEVVNDTPESITSDDDYNIEVQDLFNDGTIIAWKDKKDRKWKQLKNKPSKFFNRYDKQNKKIISKIKEKPENNETEVVVELRPIEG